MKPAFFITKADGNRLMAFLLPFAKLKDFIGIRYALVKERMTSSLCVLSLSIHCCPVTSDFLFINQCKIPTIAELGILFK